MGMEEDSLSMRSTTSALRTIVGYAAFSINGDIDSSVVLERKLEIRSETRCHVITTAWSE